METPSNPRLMLIDIEKVAAIVRSRNDILLAVDNTFLSPYFQVGLFSPTWVSVPASWIFFLQRPLELGADIVMHSATKYLNGHSDVLMGIVLTNSDQVHTRLRSLQSRQLSLNQYGKESENFNWYYYSKEIGAVPSPFECFLLNRGLKTLPVRMRQHMENGIVVGRFLENHPCVERVLHPGKIKSNSDGVKIWISNQLDHFIQTALPSHPQHELAKRQSYGHSGMVTFFLKGGREECRVFAKSLKLIYLAESLGGYESLLKIP